MYNTRTADLIASCTFGAGNTREKIDLYRTRKRGDYFFFGRGGVGTRWNGREDIAAVSINVAMNFADKCRKKRGGIVYE